MNLNLEKCLFDVKIVCVKILIVLYSILELIGNLAMVIVNGVKKDQIL